MSLETTRFANNPAYVRCQQLLKQLQEVMASGQGDSEHADKIRDAMEETRNGLDAAEVRRIEELSADLYMLTDEEIFQDVPAEERATLPQRFQQASQEEQYEHCLALLRSGLVGVPREVVAYFRGRCWGKLGDNQPAAWFFEYASQLAPANHDYAALMLSALWRAGRESEVEKYARLFIANPSAHPRVLFTAAHLLFQRATQMKEPSARPVYELVSQAVERALQKEAALPALDHIPSMTLMGRVSRTIALERLGRETEARQAHEETLRAHPTSSTARIQAGLFELRRGRREQAVRYFNRAVELGARHVLLYLFLAHQRLVENNFLEVLELCGRGIEDASKYEDLAQFHELSAIARQALGAPDHDVRELFNAAVGFDPLNFQIRRNRDAFEKFVAAQHAGPRPEFEASPSPDAREVEQEVSASLMRVRAA